MNLMSFEDKGYEPYELVDETTLTEAALEIIKESIATQFKDPSGFNKMDFVSSFLTRYALSEKIIKEDYDEEENENLRNIHRHFISYMEELFQKKLKIGIPELEDMGFEEQDQIIHYLYRFFIINVTQNMFNYVYSYIKANKTSLGEILPTTKTVSYQRMSEIMEDKDMVRICSNMSDVVKLALTDENVTVDDFFEMCKAKDYDLEREYIMEKYESFAVTGNFVKKYRKILPDWAVVELETTISTKLLREFRKK